MNKLAALLLCCAAWAMAGPRYSPAGYLNRRLHPDIIKERDVEGIEAQITGQKLVLRVEDFVRLLLKNSTDIRLVQLDYYTAADAVLAANAPFDPNLLMSFAATRSKQPQSNLISGAGTLNSLTQSSQAGYQQVLGEGPTLSSSFNAVRTSTNSVFSNLNPSIFDSLNFALTQPLLQNRGNIQLRTPLLIARTQLVITSALSKTRIADTIAAATRQYWDAVGARDFIRVQQESLDLAQRAYEHDKLSLELGALSRLDIFQSESQVAQRRVSLIQAQYAYREILDSLRRLIGADLKPATRYMEMVLQDDPGIQSSSVTVQPLEQAVAKAMDSRPELTAAGRRIAIDELNERAAQNALLPRVDLSVLGGASGLGGVPIATSSGLLGVTPVPAAPSGLGESLGQILSFKAPYYGLGITLGIPIRSSLAKANLADALVNRTRDRYNVRQIEQQIILEVKTATNEFELAREAVNAAITARDLARQNVNAEQQKYELGTITAFELLDAQTRLTQIENTVVTANVGYQKALISYQRATWNLPYQIDTLVR
ncbi:MAG: TolC family protein [Acidobacteriota bacterium]|nr:TolC family protein [Acidobacteriota bacterium]